MSVLKKVIFVVCFVLATLVVPAFLLFAFVDGTTGFPIYVSVYGIILFSILGYIVVSVKSVSKEVSDALEEMKKQNAAIAYKLTHTDALSEAPEIKATAKTPADTEKPAETKPEKINLNPADPLDFD